MGYFIREEPVKAKENPTKGYIECDICSGPIYRGDACNYGEDVYEIDGLHICGACIQDYIKEHKKELV